MNEPTGHKDTHDPLRALRERLSAEDRPPNPEELTGPLAGVRIGQNLSGTIVERTISDAAVVRLDGFPPEVTAEIRRNDWSWRDFSPDAVRVGRHVTAKVIGLNPDRNRIRLSLPATENPELWVFLNSLNPGDVLSGAVASVRRFGVFVDLDQGPPHPVFPGVGFVRIPDLTWRWFDDPSDVVEVGQRVTGVLLDADTRNGEAVLSLRDLEPDPFQEFADTAREGTTVTGTVIKLIPFGAFVEVADDVVGLIHIDELSDEPLQSPEQAVRAGERVTAVITRIDRDHRRLTLSRTRAESGR